MFSLFKSKPLLKEFVQNGFVDIHSHVLCGIDDGAETLENTKNILEAMSQMGFTQAIATPHTIALVWENTKETIVAKHKEVVESLPSETERLKLRVASEYLMDDTFMKRIESEELLTLKDKYVLVEMSYMNPPIQLFEILFALKSNGYNIVLAHPERYNFYHQDKDMYKKLKKAGCLFQINLLSTTGYYGQHVLDAANYLLSHGLIDFTGSDIHHDRHLKGFESKVQIKDHKAFQQAINNNIEFKL